MAVDAAGGDDAALCIDLPAAGGQLCADGCDAAVDDPDVEFGAPATDKDPILDAALERMKLKVAA